MLRPLIESLHTIAPVAAAALLCLAPGAAAQSPPGTDAALAPSASEQDAAALDLMSRTALERAETDALARDVLGIARAGNARIGEADAEARATLPFEEALDIARAALDVDAGGQAMADLPQGHLTVFLSFSMPDALIDQYLEDSHRYGAALVIRGLVDDDFAATLAALNRRVNARDDGTGTDGVGISLDPRAFEMFGIEAVPAFVLTERPYEHCDAEGCPPLPVFDRVLGSLSTRGALELIAERGDLKPTARAVLDRGGQQGGWPKEVVSEALTTATTHAGSPEGA